MIKVRNPRSGEVDYAFAPADEAQLARSATAARAAQPAWRALGAADRIAALQSLSRALAAAHDDLVGALSVDTGRIGESAEEVHAVRDAIAHWCEVAPRLLAPAAALPTRVPIVQAMALRTPYPLAGIIAPWNFPLLMSLIDALPGLLAGCAMLIKPSEVTPRFVDPLQRALDQVPPLAAVCRIVRGDGALGRALVRHVDVLCFTGSVATGRRVAVAAAEQFIPVHLELGGKDPAIVFADADLSRAAAAISWAGMANAGQSCLSIERVYVQRAAYRRFVDLVAAKTASLALNIDDIHRGQIGPLITATQADVIKHHLADALARGAVVECGGRLRQAGGSWFEPTVLSNVDHSMLIMREETFGPILPVMAFDTEADAIGLANDSDYGLSAAVFTDDRDCAARVARQLEAGAVSVNDAGLTAFVHEGAKQPFKFSGLGGSRMGDAAMTRFFRAGVALENVDRAWDPWWFDQSQRTLV
jgi:acyl-CoA reductase-like NAD-dependent aldehyde dehydrogenase